MGTTVHMMWFAGFHPKVNHFWVAFGPRLPVNCNPVVIALVLLSVAAKYAIASFERHCDVG
jgi:hypothetical protein